MAWLVLRASVVSAKRRSARERNGSSDDLVHVAAAAAALGNLRVLKF